MAKYSKNGTELLRGLGWHPSIVYERNNTHCYHLTLLSYLYIFSDDNVTIDEAPRVVSESITETFDVGDDDFSQGLRE